MLRSRVLAGTALLAVFAAGFLTGRTTDTGMLSSAQAQAPARVFELRTYTTNEGKLPDLNNRFRDHTTRFFEKHGMVNVGYWIPQDQPYTLLYILAYPSRDAAKKSWDAFRKDPDWQAARKASEAAGPIVQKVDVAWLSATDYSKIR